MLAAFDSGLTCCKGLDRGLCGATFVSVTVVNATWIGRADRSGKRDGESGNLHGSSRRVAPCGGDPDDGEPPMGPRSCRPCPS